MKNSYLKYLKMIEEVREPNVCKISCSWKQNGELHFFPIYADSVARKGQSEILMKS